MHISLPFLFLVLVWRGWREPGHLRGLLERFGLGPVGPKGAVWIYAASLGETRAASPLIKHLRDEGVPVLLTHLSPAGLEEGKKLFPNDEGITHSYIPVDLFWAVWLFLARARPAVGVVMEIEIWPAMMFGARWAGVPMVMANGNLLDRSIGAGWLRRQLLRLYHEFSHIFTRTDAYRDRYLSLGIAPDRVSVVGDMKYDQWIDPKHEEMARNLQKNWAVDRVVMIASSVQEEEPILLPIIQELLSKDTEVGILWVPRSPQRFVPLAQTLRRAGLDVVLRSELGPSLETPVPNGVRVVLGDSIGEMNAFYPISDIVFVGASLVDHGGHNIIEPMAFKKPVLMGPSIYGIAFAAEPASKAGAFESLSTPEALTRRLLELLGDEEKTEQMSRAAAQFYATQSAASERTYHGLKDVISSVQP